MRWITLLLATAACGTSGTTPSAPTAPLESEAAGSATPTEPTAGLALGPAGTCAVGGTATDANTGKPLAEVSIVITFQDGTKETVRTDTSGAFIAHPLTAPVRFEAYLLERHLDRPYGVGDCGVRLQFTL